MHKKPEGIYIYIFFFFAGAGGGKCNKKLLGVDKIFPVLERSFKVETKLRRELLTGIEMESIPLMELSCLVEE